MNLRLLQGTLFSFWAASVGATTHSTSLDEPFQNSFKNIKHSACVTLYNRQGRAGCGSTDRDSQSGSLFYYDGSKSLPYGYDFVAVIEEFDMTADIIGNIVSANANGNVKGIVVLNSTDVNDTNEYSSPGAMYPLGYNTPSADVSYGNIQFPWNGNGEGLNQYDLYGVPMVYLNEYETSHYIRDAAQDTEKAQKINTEFNFYMGPDGTNSKECLAWKDVHDNKWNPKCLPLGGTSVWGFAGSPPTSSSGNNQNNEKPTVIIGTSTDSTSMFHDLAPGANEGASNILTLLMAAKLIGSSVSDETLDALPNRIVFGFFEGEAYGYLGSRSFLRDVMEFSCDSEYTVKSVARNKKSDDACLYPLRPSLKFKDLGEIAGMLTLDQLGVPTGGGNLYVHNDGDDTMGSFLASCLMNTGTSYYTAVASAAGDNADEFPYPPTPLTSLQSLSGGASGGAVLTGYDYSFTKRPPYQSHLNSNQIKKMNLKAIASAATIVARTALAAAYDDGSYDYDTASAYANDIIPELSYDNGLLKELADCLFVNGNCDKLKTYASMEARNEAERTGFEISSGEPLGTPPNYYVGVYGIDYGQPFVSVGKKVYGAYVGNKYGKSSSDSFGMQPAMLDQAIRNMLHDFLGRGSGYNSSPKKCKKASDCSGVSYCSASGDSATCSGAKICVCKRAHYHIALDEAFTPAVNNYTGYFEFSADDAGVSPAWTEPYWSSNVGVKMYRVTKSGPGFVTIVFGAGVLAGCFFLTVIVKVAMKKEKVY